MTLADIRLLARLVALAALVSAPVAARAQSPESELAPPPGEFEPVEETQPRPTFFVPDVPRAVEKKTEVASASRWFTIKPGLVMIADYTAFSQDDTSVSQVGVQRDQWDDRAARLMFRGGMGTVKYVAAAEYKGFESDPEQTWQLTDLALIIPLGHRATTVTLGKQKETFAYEMAGDAANLPAQERVLNPFFVSRNVGVTVRHLFGARHNVNLSAGVYNDWWVNDEDFDDSGTDVTARLTALAWSADEGRSYLHVGSAWRYAGADNDTMRFKARPESNVASNYLDTGTISGDHSKHLGFEALWNRGPFSALGEYIHGWVRSDISGDPQFKGYYGVVSYVLTGENRPYDRTVGYARRVMPRGRWGAPELVLRYTHEDLDDGVVQGGSFDKTYLGVNWWATRRWKFGVGWGYTWLDRFGTTGRTHAVLTRFQWVY
jgi:phosphate-selective porin OprO and OprP